MKALESLHIVQKEGEACHGTVPIEKENLRHQELIRRMESRVAKSDQQLRLTFQKAMENLKKESDKFKAAATRANTALDKLVAKKQALERSLETFRQENDQLKAQMQTLQEHVSTVKNIQAQNDPRYA